MSLSKLKQRCLKFDPKAEFVYEDDNFLIVINYCPDPYTGLTIYRHNGDVFFNSPGDVWASCLEVRPNGFAWIVSAEWNPVFDMFEERVPEEYDDFYEQFSDFVGWTDTEGFYYLSFHKTGEIFYWKLPDLIWFAKDTRKLNLESMEKS